MIAELLDSLKRISGPGWPRQRCQVAEEAATTRVYGTTRGGSGGRGRKRLSIEWTCAVVSGKHAPSSKVFHRQAKRIKLHGARIIGGETMDRTETLDKIRSYQDIVEVKWFRKH